jgi:hypothetical protein
MDVAHPIGCREAEFAKHAPADIQLQLSFFCRPFFAYLPVSRGMLDTWDLILVAIVHADKDWPVPQGSHKRVSIHPLIPSECIHPCIGLTPKRLIESVSVN